MGANDKVAATFANSQPTDGIDLSGIQRLSDVIYDIAYTHGWYDEPRTFGDRIALITSELSEALEEHRDGHAFGEIRYVDGKPEGVIVELADAVIRILDWCSEQNADLVEAIVVKVAYNDTRPYRHGGKAL